MYERLESELRPHVSRWDVSQTKDSKCSFLWSVQFRCESLWLTADPCSWLGHELDLDRGCARRRVAQLFMMSTDLLLAFKGAGQRRTMWQIQEIASHLYRWRGSGGHLLIKRKKATTNKTPRSRDRQSDGGASREWWRHRPRRTCVCVCVRALWEGFNCECAREIFTVWESVALKETFFDWSPIFRKLPVNVS